MQHSPIRKPLGTAIMLVLAGGANNAVAGQANTVAMDATGNSVVVWQDSSGADGDLGGIFARRYDANGVPATAAAFQVNTTTPGDQQAPVSAMAANGDFVVVWQGIDEGVDGGIYAQQYTADGSALGNEIRVNSITSGVQQHPAVAMNAGGNFVVAWEDALADSSGIGIMARAYLADGTVLGDAFAVNSITAGDQLNPSVAIADSGAFTISWQGADGAVQMQRFDVNGIAVDGETTVAEIARTGVAGLMAGAAAATSVDLGLGMSSSYSGNTLIFNISVANYGNTASGAVSLVDTLPSNTTYKSANGSGWTCSNNTPSSGKVTCDLASLAANASSTVTVKVDTTGASATSLTNSATVTTSGDINSANDTASKTVTTTGSSGGGGGGGAFGWLFGLLLGFFGLRRRCQ